MGTAGGIMSDFAGRVFHVDGDGARTELLNRTVTKGYCADMCFIPHLKLLVVPSLYDNRLTAYRVGE
jgi:hypothetical protein